MLEPPPLHLDEQLASVIPPVQLPAGTVIFAKGSKLPSALLVRAGDVRLELAHPELSQPSLLRTCGPGDVVSPGGLAPNPIHHCQAVASTRVEGFLLSHAMLEKLGQIAPAKALAVTQLLFAQAVAELAASQPGHLEERLLAEADGEDEQILTAARAAQQTLATWDEERINRLINAIRQAVISRAEHFSQRECEESGIGSLVDKVHKLGVVCNLVGAQLLGVRPIGKLSEDAVRKVSEYGAPVGVIFAIVPATNPIPNSLFKLLNALKTRNAIVFSYPRALVGVGDELVTLVHDVLRAEGAPVDIVQHLGRRAGRLRVSRMLRNPAVDLVLATGGPGLVNAAYSSGNPAYGVGPGNVPVLVAADANLERAAEQIVASKSYDHGIICGSENNLVVDRRVHEGFVAALTRQGALVLSVEQTDRAIRVWFDPETRRIHRSLLGQPAQRFAEVAELDTRGPVRIIVMTALPRHLELLGREKLAPIVTLFVEDVEGTLPRCRELIELEGKGHTAVIHSEDAAVIEKFAEVMPAGRLLVNTPATFGMMGVSTNLPTSFLLGSGTFGKNITTDGISWRHLINVKRLAHHAHDPNDLTRE